MDLYKPKSFSVSFHAQRRKGAWCTPKICILKAKKVMELSSLLSLPKTQQRRWSTFLGEGSVEEWQGRKEGALPLNNFWNHTL